MVDASDAGAGPVAVRAASGPPAVGIKLTEDEIDMRKLEDREQWYIARFCADDAPDWNEARFIRRCVSARSPTALSVGEVAAERTHLVGVTRS